MIIKDELQQLITVARARIGVIGLGYVGLPLIVEFCFKGFESIGFEVDEPRNALSPEIRNNCKARVVRL